MASVPGAQAVKSFLLSAIFFSLLLCPTTAVPRRLAALVKEPPLVLQHHGGALLKGSVTVNLVWYGRFSPSQRAIVVDFLLSLGDTRRPLPSVASWWATTTAYGRGGKTQISLGKQILDEGCSLGKSLKSVDLVKLAGKIAGGGAAVNVVLTADDVAVEGFCMSRCGTHGVWRDKAPFVWVGNSVSQCPGQCAWPFHQPVYGPQTPPLVAPNGDVGVDGMVINLAGLLAGTVTNPFGDGYFQGPKGAGLEAASACAGIFGSGAYPGYPGKTLLDGAGGGSYNANGLGGRRYLLPALWDPRSSRCSTVV